jgi:hypothetical protein
METRWIYSEEFGAVIGTLAGLPIPIALYCIIFDILATGLHVR